MMKDSGTFPLLRPIIEALQFTNYSLGKNRKIIQEYMIVRYEDLATRTEETMRHICAFLNIPCNQDNLEPTVDGTPWQGNSTSCRPFTGVESKRVNPDDLRPIEHTLIQRFMSDSCAHFGYQPPARGGRIRYREKGETMQTYFANRSYAVWGKCNMHY